VACRGLGHPPPGVLRPVQGCPPRSFLSGRVRSRHRTGAHPPGPPAPPAHSTPRPTAPRPGGTRQRPDHGPAAAARYDPSATPTRPRSARPAPDTRSDPPGRSRRCSPRPPSTRGQDHDGNRAHRPGPGGRKQHRPSVHVSGRADRRGVGLGVGVVSLAQVEAVLPLQRFRPVLRRAGAHVVVRPPRLRSGRPPGTRRRGSTRPGKRRPRTRRCRRARYAGGRTDPLCALRERAGLRRTLHTR